MADPDGAVEVQGTVAPRAAAGKRDPDMIVADIEQTRENLTRTIDALTERVSPANNVRRLKERAAQQAARPDVQLVAVAVGLAVVGFAIYRIWGRRRK
ncbi:MAG TPA: DUF3618 domain-containing protein [Streptosporangiaceae bacterium]|nr:DUF3618 domain-containing protein [Streptosporangiaceae bacterium]